MKNRKENIRRRNTFKNPPDHPEFLVYHFYQKDLESCILRYAEGNLLDIGCGNKPYKSIVNKKTLSYIGCDIVQSSDNCVDVLCEATNIPLPDKSYHTVLSTQTIEHVENPQQLINEAYRLLKKGGHFILSGPFYWPLHEEPYDFFRFSKHGFKYMLEKSGFEVLETKSNGGKWALCGQVIIQTIWPDIERKKGIKAKMLRLIFYAFGGIKGINRFFLRMDERFKNEKTTLNYVVVGRKN